MWFFDYGITTETLCHKLVVFFVVGRGGGLYTAEDAEQLFGYVIT